MKPEEVVVSPWVPVIVQIALGLITIAGSGVVVQWLNARQAHRDFLRGKLETLFEAFSKYQQICLSTISIWSLVVNGKMTYQEALARDEKELQSVPDYFATVQMLIYLYFPDLLDECGKCSTIFENAMPYVVHVRSRGSSSPPETSIGPRLSDCLTEFLTASGRFKVTIGEYGKSSGLLKENKQERQVSPR
jgi:hypothetical protein